MGWELGEGNLFNSYIKVNHTYEYFAHTSIYKESTVQNMNVRMMIDCPDIKQVLP